MSRHLLHSAVTLTQYDILLELCYGGILWRQKSTTCRIPLICHHGSTTEHSAWFGVTWGALSQENAAKFGERPFPWDTYSIVKHHLRNISYILSKCTCASAVGPTLWQQGGILALLGASGQLSMMICDMTEVSSHDAIWFHSTSDALRVLQSKYAQRNVQWLTSLWPASIGLQLPIFNSI